MKKIYLIAAMVCMALCASAQQRLSISTYSGTNLDKYDGKEMSVTVNRYVFRGWNTLCLPFDVTTDELNETFGADCRLEQLVGVETGSQGLVLNFQDCKAAGMEAGRPYILYYTGENGSKKLTKDAVIKRQKTELTFTDSRTGAIVTMGGAQVKTSGDNLYGVLARDNAEATFVNTSTVANGFYATRCYVSVSTGNNTILTTNHLGEGEATAINAIARSGERVDVFTVSGIKVADRIDGLQPGVYVVKGKKVMVK